MKTLVLAAALLALAAPAHAQNAPAAPKANQAAVSSATQRFVRTAAMTDMFEIQAGQLAQQKADNPAYKDFAQMVINDHTKTSNELKSMNLSGVQLPTELDRTHKAEIDRLNSLSGAAFERRFRTDQVQGHLHAIARFERYSRTGDNSEVKQWAQNTLPTLQKHLQAAQALPRPGPAPTVGSAPRR